MTTQADQRSTMSRVLIIDDDDGLRELLSAALTADGHDVLTATDGLAGLHLALHQAVDLVVLDLQLPHLDGYSLLKALRSEQPTLEILVLSADTRLTSRVQCLESGASDYLRKPFHVPELMARVHARLRQAPSPSRTVAHSGGLQLDPSRLKVTLQGRPVAVSSKEFSLLSYLLHRVGDVCTRPELLREIWGYDFDADSNVVEVYISRLRHKLGNDMIETVRNVGYTYLVS